LIVEAGDVREVHHVALLIGYGAAAVNPYLAIESVEDLARHQVYTSVAPEKAVGNVIKALGKGVLKVMSKMGVSTVASYTGLRSSKRLAFARGGRPLLHGDDEQAGGVTLEQIAEEVRRRHLTAYPLDGIPLAHRLLAVGGEYQWRREGEPHLSIPRRSQAAALDPLRTLRHLQAVHPSHRHTIRAADDVAGTAAVLPRTAAPYPSKRSNLAARSSNASRPVRCRTGRSARRRTKTLAIAMNRIGGRSNTGEGGEDKDRLYDPERRSAVKQVAPAASV
jgi:glutamate synthase (NADPH/NADH) large chain